jgi:hypothetical protein
MGNECQEKNEEGVGDQVICLIIIVFRPKNRRFQVLEGRF